MSSSGVEHNCVYLIIQVSMVRARATAIFNMVARMIHTVDLIVDVAIM